MLFPVLVILGICVTGSHSQFQTLRPVTIAPPLPGQATVAPPLPGHNTVAPPLPGHNTVAPLLPGGFDPTCVDKLHNCDQFPEVSCKPPYEAWAKDNCKNRCKFCHGPTVPPPECKNNLRDCETYPKDVCNDPKYKQWSETQCRYYCRKCSPTELALKDAITTTMSPTQCVDKLQCGLYGKASCCGNYRKWAEDNCPVYCGICKGTPGPPTPCADKLPNCSRYKKDSCTNPSFKQWAEVNCMKYCNLCHLLNTNNGDPCANSPGFPHPPLPVSG
ncbi:putative tyrosinase-like protein tyr-3 isoform X2 [Gigantopelta aegis]|uniref:putative tyrosinase-like protein tyr-3 isoform X2 n=1 Tax=Gigantopelta aegis TaxID=1735272 RepID=UPI001B8884E6|nr:putative tyrosinase-like protein tyr-3 isoform X2 [Gigantopelta aegis]